jgi:excisionase family DNA binding protein
MGKVESVYKDDILRQGHAQRRETSAVINHNGILHIKEVMKAGEVLSVRLRPRYRLKNVVLGSAHQLQVIPDDKRLQYWITVGRDGVVEITGEMARDDDNLFAKLRSNLKDIPFRAYAVQQTLAAREGNPIAPAVPDVMTTQEAAHYLLLSVSKVYKLAQSGELKRTPQKRFRKPDLDAYLQSKPKGRKAR